MRSLFVVSNLLALSATLALASAAVGAAQIDGGTSATDPRLSGFEQSKVKTILAIEEVGDEARLVREFTAIRSMVEAIVQSENPGAMQVLTPLLDQHFASEEIAAAAVEPFTHQIHEGLSPIVVAWANNPRMKAVNQAIRDFDPTGADGAPVVLSAERRSLLQQLVEAMNFKESIRSRLSAYHWLSAALADAVDPDASHLLHLQQNPARIQLPDDSTLIDGWLAPALVGFEDQQIAEFLEFAQGEAGSRYFVSYSIALSHQHKDWYLRLVDLVKDSAQKAVEQSPSTDASQLVEEARHLLHVVGTRTVVAEARTLLLKAERLNPQDAEVQALLGEVLMGSRPGPKPQRGELRVESAAENFAEAEAHFRRSIELDPGQADSLVRLGHALFLQGRDAEARALYDRAEKINPEHPWLRINYADLAQAEEKYSESIELYRRVLATPQRVSGVHFAALSRSRMAFEQAGRLDDYSELGFDYLARNPKSPDFRLIFGEHLLSVNADPAQVLSVVDAIPDRWQPQFKTSLMVRALLARAYNTRSPQHDLSAAGFEDVKRAISLQGSASDLVRAICNSPSPVTHAALVVPLSESQADTATLVLGCAVRDQVFDLIKPMVVAGADINARSVPPWGETPLGMAAGTHSVEGFQLLLENGADPERPFSDGRTARQFIGDRREPKIKQMLKVLDEFPAPGAGR